MKTKDRLCSLAFRAYPPDFRREYREEMLGTIADRRDAGECRSRVHEAAVLAFHGLRLRWSRATGGSVASTLRQGLAWGVLALVARQAGLGIAEVTRPLVQGWGDRSLVAAALLAAGWLLVFCLLATGRRRWGLGALAVVLAGFVAHSVQVALGYGGPFSWTFTLGFFLPAALPLLPALAWPPAPFRLPSGVVAAALFLAVLIPPLSSVRSPLLGVAIAAVVGSGVLLAALADPRWAVATALVIFVPVVQSLIPAIGSGRVVQAGAGALMILVLVPTSAVYLSLRARRTAWVRPPA